MFLSSNKINNNSDKISAQKDHKELINYEKFLDIILTLYQH